MDQQKQQQKHVTKNAQQEHTTNVSSNTTNTKRNAFAELMSARPSKQAKSDVDSTTDTSTIPPSIKPTKPNFYALHNGHNPNDPRSGLLPYITHPETFPPTTVLRITPDTVLIRDLYPKASIHLLLLPRSPTHRNLHPHDAFQDPEFLSLMKSEAQTAATLAASELSRLISPYSEFNRALNAALDPGSSFTFAEGQEEEVEEPTLPAGRDYLSEIRIGIHAHPSMSHLHIHIISRDMHSVNLKHRKHYNSFNTPFFIPLATYPLSDTDEDHKKLTSTKYQNDNLKADYLCWRCGRAFGNRFKELKEHLELEFRAWREE